MALDTDGSEQKFWGTSTLKNVQGRLRSGYELVRADEYPEEEYPSYQDGKYVGVIGHGGLVLTRVPESVAKSRSEYYQRMHEDKVKAVDNDLMRETGPENANQY